MNDKLGKHNEYKPRLTVTGFPADSICDTINLANGYYAYLDIPRKSNTAECIQELETYISLLNRKRPLKEGKTSNVTEPESAGE